MLKRQGANSIVGDFNGVALDSRVVTVLDLGAASLGLRNVLLDDVVGSILLESDNVVRSYS